MHRRIPKRAFLAAALAAMGCLLGGPQAGRGATDYVAQADQIAKAQLQRFGKGYNARVDRNRHIVYVSALDDGHLKQTIQLLSAFTDAYRRTLPSEKPAWNVTVALPATEDYRKLTLPFANCVGFYNHGNRRLVSIDRGRTLVHEFTHALHHADTAVARQVHPIWVCEGLATLFEASEITPSGLKPKLDRRLPTLQRALKAKKAIALQRLLTMGREPFLKDAALAYAQVRYVMFYVHHRGRLADWYKRYKATFTHDPNGVKALEAALGNRLFQIEPAWRTWVLAQRMPSSEIRTQQARLGLQLQNDSRGVKVVGLLPGSSAKLSGRILVGDVIEQFNGHRTSNPAELVGAIRAAGALQTVKVQLLRHGRRTIVLQPLGAPSSR